MNNSVWDGPVLFYGDGASGHPDAMPPNCHPEELLCEGPKQISSSQLLSLSMYPRVYWLLLCIDLQERFFKFQHAEISSPLPYNLEIPNHSFIHPKESNVFLQCLCRTYPIGLSWSYVVSPILSILMLCCDYTSWHHYQHRHHHSHHHCNNI